MNLEHWQYSQNAGIKTLYLVPSYRQTVASFKFISSRTEVSKMNRDRKKGHTKNPEKWKTQKKCQQVLETTKTSIGQNKI
jgi:pterin-4a-carbinolamine dehydratase